MLNGVENQQTVRREQGCHALENRLSAARFKIHQHVAAKDHVE